ncbi:UNVERIFIED_CONTAM: hypothetical protein Slati_1911000 [Sesamum latifolium]|uniref:DUF4283 domain-containing protein n=1 Tax=Sesamum latifolium TaxID=2727402 RepID=A0AAW2X2P7_9LAMI
MPLTTLDHNPDLRPPNPPDRRSFLKALTGDGEGSVLSPRAAKKIFADDKDFFGKFCLHRGGKAINFSVEEIEILADHLKFTMVGKFSHGYPSMQAIRACFAKLGLRGAYSVGVINIKHILIELSNEEDLARLWLKQILFVDGFPMRMFKWSPDFNPKVESSFPLVWIRFSELPVHLFYKKALYGIASLTGLPLKLDEATAEGHRPSVARVCIELDLTKPRPNSLWIGNDGKFMAQSVIYER